ncbi:B3/B4 domain-containing protein [Microlunatus speluncae]|uniref:B3/B4 domain-containing protein n=1 Tax=Microlunatus speluncae TaxID=2594267 RepID=UPI00147968C9|nr:phenylalanine--tRNA ligase beta subunit-related protein [Microlunatus speluncae]
MQFRHSGQIWQDYPELVAGAMIVEGIDSSAVITDVVAELSAEAEARLAENQIRALPEIQAWRRIFARMGLKPTQYRCAAESLLRRFGKDGSLPRIHPLVDLLNAISIAYAIPIAVFDLDRVDDQLEVRYADGTETYQAFSGDEERPRPGEVIFVDSAGRAHARRWTHRQSARSAITDRTRRVLIVAEAVHDRAGADVAALVDRTVAQLSRLWPAAVTAAILTAAAPTLGAAPEG